MKSTDIENAKLDPTEYFDDPKQVLNHTDLESNDKVSILRQWEYDLRELLVAEEENMPADENGETLHEKLQQIRESLYKLDATEGTDAHSK